MSSRRKYEARCKRLKSAGAWSFYILPRRARLRATTVRERFPSPRAQLEQESWDKRRGARLQTCRVAIRGDMSLLVLHRHPCHPRVSRTEARGGARLPAGRVGLRADASADFHPRLCPVVRNFLPQAATWQP